MNPSTLTSEGLMEAIRNICADYKQRRDTEQTIWAAMNHQARVEKLLEFTNDVTLAENLAQRDQLIFIPEPIFTKLMGNL